VTWSTLTSLSATWTGETSDGGTWTGTGSDTTARNTSRFVLLGDTQGSAVTLTPHFRTADEGGRGIPFYLTVGDYVMLSINSGAI